MNWLINLITNRGNDLSTFFIPNAYFFKSAILNFRQLPLWNPTQFAGYPYVADPQNFIFYLPNYLFLLLPIEIGFLILLLVHLAWAGWGVFNLSRRIFKLKPLFALFASVIFVLTPKIFSHLEAGHYSMIIALSWLPWFFLCALKFIDQPTIKNTIFLSLISFFLYANYINIAYFSILFFVLYSVFSFIFSKRLQNTKLYLAHYTLYLILFLGFISPLLLPQIKLAPLSTRNLITFDDVAQPIWSFKLFVQNLFFPYLLNLNQLSTERVLYPGILVLFLSVYGYIKSTQKHKLFFLSWLCFSLLFSLGKRIPFFIFFFKYFPLMHYMRVTTRLWIISLLFIAIFAALGLQHLSKFKKIQRNLITVLLLFLIVFSVADLIVIDKRIFSKTSTSTQIPSQFYKYLKDHLNQNQKVYCPTGCLSLNQLGKLGINSISGNNPVQLSSFVNFLQTAGGYDYSNYVPILPPYQTFTSQPQPSAKLLGLLNTQYIISPYYLTDESLLLLAEQSGFFLYQNTQANSVWLANKDGTAKLDYFSPNKIIVDVATQRNDFLSLSELYYPGWKAIDQLGRKIKVVNTSPLRGVEIDAQTKRVVFYYYPNSLTIGVSIFIFTILLSIYAYHHPQLISTASRKRR